jgi:hypothetical protein
VSGPPPEGSTRYEERDVAMRPIVVAAIALLIVIVGSFALMRVLDLELRGRASDRGATPSPFAETYGRREPPAPRLQDDPRRDLAVLRAREQAVLDGYGWIDRGSGRVHIPVAQAMARVLAEGTR